MSLRVAFSDGCDADVRRVRGRTARTVCEALTAFARDGSGKVVAPGDDEPSGLLRVYGWGGFASVELRPNVVYVHGIFSTMTLPQATPILDTGLPFPDDD